MSSEEYKIITVQATINAPCEKVWELWTSPEHIIKWNYASDEWHTPHAENDLQAGGKFLYRMEAKDGSMGFDFHGVYKTVKTNELIEYVLGDGRKVSVVFNAVGNETKVTEKFEAEETNPHELQQKGWQAILDNFKRHVESD
jgi:uncharacterized protein YndB with AHSA1/START domain